jgi:PPM family protein phosphatase
VILRAWGITDLGRKRSVNEDSHYLDPDGELFLVLDGMGGHRAGEIASRVAMDTMTKFYKENSGSPQDLTDVFENYDHSFSYQANLLRQAVFLANRVVLETSVAQEEFHGMGSTVAGMAVHGYTLSMINVGDSRMYLIRDGILEQISRDHTLAEDQIERGIMSRDEVRDSQLRHILSSVIGVDGRIRVYMDELAAIPGDIVLLCTDGLTAVMDDEEILARVLERGVGPDTLDKMIDEANARGGPDNTTIILAVFEEEPDEDD